MGTVQLKDEELARDLEFGGQEQLFTYSYHVDFDLAYRQLKWCRLI